MDENSPKRNIDAQTIGPRTHNRYSSLASLDERDSPECELSLVERQGPWIKVPATLDSGAAENVCPRNMLPKILAQRNVGAKQFVAANGAKIKDEGVKVVKFRTKEGVDRRIQFVVADVVKPLVSMSKVITAGNRVILKDQQPHLVCNKTGRRTDIYMRSGLYVLDMWLDESQLGQVFSGQGK